MQGHHDHVDKQNVFHNPDKLITNCANKKKTENFKKTISPKVSQLIFS